MQLNEEIIKESNGKRIRFGDLVCLYHYDSRNFLKCLRNPSETSIAGSKCELVESLDPHCNFTLEPRFKSKKAGDLICGEDMFLIKNQQENLYLNIDPEPTVFAYDINLQEEDKLSPLRYYFDPFCNIHKLFFKISSMKTWTFDKFLKVYSD